MAEKICDRIAIIKKGKIIEVGTMAEIREKSRESGGVFGEYFPGVDRIMKEIISLTKLFINESLGLSLFFYNQKFNKRSFINSYLP